VFSYKSVPGLQYQEQSCVINLPTQLL